MEHTLKKFINNDTIKYKSRCEDKYEYGDGYGYGYGYEDEDGDGDGYGYGYGNGDGDGYGNGYGYGYRNGDGYGYNITTYNNYNIYMIDNIQTGIYNIRNNIASGFILNTDLTITNCYIVKQDNLFAHGSSIKEAYKSLNEKIYNNTSLDQLFIKFNNTFIHGIKYKGKEFFKWHGYLTKSCELGRKSFCKNNNINLNDTFTITEFIKLTKDSYQGDIIKQLNEYLINK